MEHWTDKVIVVTGAATGIGAAVTASLVENGVVVVGLDIDHVNMKKLADNLVDQPGKFHAIKTDLQNESEILDAFSWIESNLGAVHGCVNNAGILREYKPISECETDDIRDLFNIHVLAMQVCIRESLKAMKKHSIDDGVIINICSVVSKLSSPRPGYVTYGTMKTAISTITEGLRVELALMKSNIKTMLVCPGLVNSKLYEKGGLPFPNRPSIQPEDVAKVIVFCLQLPPNVQISEVVVRPLGEDFTRP